MLVYTVQLEDECFYVGRVKNAAMLAARVEQHYSGKGAEWTKQHQCVSLYNTIDNAKPTDEDGQVIALMVEHGVDKVRGGTFCTPELSEDEVKFLTKMVDSARGSCYFCHETGHCTHECPENMMRKGDWICPDCDDTVWASKNVCRCGKWKPKEYKTAAMGTGKKPGDWTCPSCGDNVFAYKKACRCGTAKPVPPEKEEMPPPKKPVLKRARDEEEEKEEEPAKKKPRVEVEMKSGDWACPGCDYHNFASRTMCKNCKKVKPHKDAEPIGTCVVCLDKPVKVAALPCGHFCFCETCAAAAGDECPM
jgi:hypothetical protein